MSMYDANNLEMVKNFIDSRGYLVKDIKFNSNGYFIFTLTHGIKDDLILKTDDISIQKYIEEKFR